MKDSPVDGFIIVEFDAESGGGMGVRNSIPFVQATVGEVYAGDHLE